ncbi:MAG: preprotein translocase subunit SecG [Acidobacteriia bacterium]|jgi:preprotein translocase subunit SecG|nr:preprotein translocase subunit SecG [Terriglobia bacterium]
MILFLEIIHVVVCLLLILIVLLQSGKSADLAGAFGGGGSQTAFGARGTATFLSKLTTGAAVIFMITSFTLSLLISQDKGRSIMQDAEALSTETNSSTEGSENKTDLSGSKKTPVQEEASGSSQNK